MLISDLHAAAEARGDGLHPTLRARLVQTCQTAEITKRVDGMSQAGPSPASEASFQGEPARSYPGVPPMLKILPNDRH
jgi:hypothetical protein